jgi:diguanylate cyclase (GGDEF)-like protein/PAS domain S-box-containing protein
MLSIEEHEIYRNVLEGLQTGVYVLDRAGKILLWNRGAEKLTGFLQYEVIGHCCQDNILPQCNHHGCESCRGECPFGTSLGYGLPHDFRIQLAHKRGHSIQVLMHSEPVFDANGAAIATAQSFDQQRFATDSEPAQRSLSTCGGLDEAEVPNCSYARLQLQESLAAFVDYHLPFGVILIQVDHLGEFRAAYGRPAGDAILRVVAQTVRNSLHSGDFLGRWADDQFLVVLPNCSPVGVQLAGDRLARLLSRPKLQWWGDEHSVTTSIGRALVQEGDSLESLLQRAKPGVTSAASGDVAHSARASTYPNGAEVFKG